MKIKRDKKIVLKAFAVCAIILVLVVLFFHLKPFVTFVLGAEQRQERLLSNTDHQALLQACRKLSRRVSTGDLEPGQYRVRIDPHEEASQFPQQILELEPTYVEIESDGRICIELFGGFIHFGVIAYPEDFRLQGDARHREVQLIPGLWYYNHEYRKDPNYKKMIDELIQKGKMRQIEKNASNVRDENNNP